MPKNRALAMDFDMRSYIVTFMFVMMALVVSGCASSYDDSATPGMSDPFENTNRAVFDFNQTVDSNVIHPIVDGYRYIVPQPARTGVHNVLNNLQSPVSLANELLQGDVDGAGMVTFRAVVNTLVGFGGLFDFAGAEGYTVDGEDFGQTLAVWGVDHGPYIVVPILGSSSVRDYSGYFVDSFADPLRWYLFNHGEEHIYYKKMGVKYLDVRNELKDTLEELQFSSIDYYASVRNTYYQARKALASDQGSIVSDSDDAYPDFDDY